MRIVYFGSGAFGLPTLDALAHEHDVALVVTQPDRPAGRGKALTPTVVAQWCGEHRADIPIIKPEHVNDPLVVRRVRETESDAWVVIAFGQKLGSPLLADRFAVNLHASLLPRWRGAAPINHAILAGDVETGDTVITLADRMDAGMILAQSRRPIGPSVTAGELHDLLAADGPALVWEILRQHQTGSLRPTPQDESQVTYAGKFTKDEGWVNWGQPGSFVRRMVHGLTPWPGAAAVFRGERLLIRRVEEARDGSEQEPGTIVDAARGVIACGRGSAVRALEVQPAGGRAMAWEEFARGKRVTAGERMGSETPC